MIRLYIDTTDTSSQADIELDPEEMKVSMPSCVFVFEGDRVRDVNLFLCVFV